MIPTQSPNFTHGRTKAWLGRETQSMSQFKLVSGLGLKPHLTNCFPQWIPSANINYPNLCPVAKPVNHGQKRVPLLLSVPFPISRMPCHLIPTVMVSSVITAVWWGVNKPEVPTKNHRLLETDPGSVLFKIWSLNETESYHLKMSDA